MTGEREAEQHEEARPSYPSARLVLQRWQEARFILAGAVVACAAAAAVGSLDPRWAVTVVAAIFLTAAFPRGSRSRRLAEKRQRDKVEISWQRAIELPVQALDEPAYLLRADATVKFQNQAAIELFGLAETDLHLSTRIRSPAILGIVQQAIDERVAAHVEHVERVPAERWFHVRCTPLEGTPANDRRGRLFLLTFRDMSEAKRMDRMRSDFVANASHELRTPLASLTGFIETIQGPARNDLAARERFLAIMHEQASRMTRLVEDLMSLSRLELKAHLAPTGSVDLAQLVAHVCDTLRPLGRELDVTITFDRPDGPVMVRGDRDELIQVFENLIENACKYGQAGKLVEVSLRPVEAAGRLNDANDMVEVEVRDYGPGIPPEHVPRLTERFYRVDIESSRSKKGTGLGLAIVKHILTRHRTRLVVSSRLGEGSAFSVRLSRVNDIAITASRSETDKNQRLKVS
jgi:two-component system phosphate regulon sensor histidine kinase PhoR